MRRTPVLRLLAAHHLAVLLLQTLAFKICSQLNEPRDLMLRTKTANSCWDFCKAKVLVPHLSRLVRIKTSTSGSVSHQSLMRRSHVRLRLLD
jgi:hypothetical protein